MAFENERPRCWSATCHSTTVQLASCSGLVHRSSRCDVTGALLLETSSPSKEEHPTPYVTHSSCINAPAGQTTRTSQLLLQFLGRPARPALLGPSTLPGP
jgi:hypothetical protein